MEGYIIAAKVSVADYIKLDIHTNLTKIKLL